MLKVFAPGEILLIFKYTTMKKIFTKAFAVLSIGLMFASCATISQPVTVTTNPFGSKCGVSKSTLYLGGLWSSKGEENGIDKAAKSAGIKKISHVDSYMKSYLLGLYMEQTIKVYGE